MNVTSLLIPTWFRNPAKDASRRVEGALAAHFDGLYRFLRRLGVPDADVEDALQEVAIIATTRAQAIEEGREKAFLFGVAFRVGNNARRKVTVRREVADDAIAELRAEDDLEATVAAKSELVWFQRVVDAMPEDLRAVYLLHEVEEHAMVEIAEALGIPSGTVASRLRRARAHIQEAARGQSADVASAPDEVRT